MSAANPATNVIRLPLAENTGVSRVAGTGYAAPFVLPRLGSLHDIDYLRTFDDGIYRDLDIELTLDYMRRRFVVPLSRHVDIGTSTIMDCAAGFGWLSFAYVLAGGKQAIFVELDEQRLDAARAIAARLGVERRCLFVAPRIQDIDFGDDAVDVFASVETLEHVGRGNLRACVSNMARLARQAVMLTAPNFLFPVVAHDTELPVAHWLPAGLRHRYATARGRADMDRGNQFPLPWDLAAAARQVPPGQPLSNVCQPRGIRPLLSALHAVRTAARQALPHQPAARTADIADRAGRGARPLFLHAGAEPGVNLASPLERDPVRRKHARFRSTGKSRSTLSN